MKTIHKDITTVDEGIIVHQVNCEQVMGSGVAKAIRDKWPQVYESYIQYSKDMLFMIPFDLLGSVDFCEINDKLTVANLFGQYTYRKKGEPAGRRYTKYGGWEMALPRIRHYAESKNMLDKIYFPYNVGCDRGGGDFRIISMLIEEVLPEAIICDIRDFKDEPISL